jgi:hypothetical protein
MRPYWLESPGDGRPDSPQTAITGQIRTPNETGQDRRQLVLSRSGLKVRRARDLNPGATCAVFKIALPEFDLPTAYNVQRT